MNIYLDVCCLNRPFDDQSQDRIRVESAAVAMIIQLCTRGVHRWHSSDVIELEVSKSPDPSRRSLVQDLLKFADVYISLGAEAKRRATTLVTEGLKPMDALHLGVAEAGGCDILLTTDDRFERCVKGLNPLPRVRVENPARWVTEAIST